MKQDPAGFAALSKRRATDASTYFAGFCLLRTVDPTTGRTPGNGPTEMRVYSFEKTVREVEP